MSGYRLRDTQKSKVYAWESEKISPLDRSHVPFDQIQNIVNYVWSNEGLKYPPKVSEMPANARKVLATGERMNLRFPARGVATWVILHELAHSLNSSIDDIDNEDNDRHGPNFVGLYMQLLIKYLKLDQIMLLGTARMHKVKVNVLARPLFLDT